MSRNKFSEIGAAEDLLRSIVQMSCAEIHAMGLYYKCTAQMENGLVDVTDPEVLRKQLDKADMYQEDIETYGNLRRSMMRSLFDMFEGGDKDMWCMVKHLGLSAMQAFEAYENSDNDPALLNISYEANKAFTRAITRFLGMEIQDCAACLSDALKGTYTEDDANVKGEYSDGSSN